MSSTLDDRMRNLISATYFGVSSLERNIEMGSQIKVFYLTAHNVAVGNHAYVYPVIGLLIYATYKYFVECYCIGVTCERE